MAEYFAGHVDSCFTSIVKSNDGLSGPLSFIYPNPTKEYLVISALRECKDINVKMYTSESVLLDDVTFKYDDKLKMKVNDLSNGLYYVLLSCDKKLEVLKFIKQ
jgi:hypothetical protein